MGIFSKKKEKEYKKEVKKMLKPKKEHSRRVLNALIQKANENADELQEAVEQIISKNKQVA